MLFYKEAQQSSKHSLLGWKPKSQQQIDEYKIVLSISKVRRKDPQAVSSIASPLSSVYEPHYQKSVVSFVKDVDIILVP